MQTAKEHSPSWTSWPRWRTSFMQETMFLNTPKSKWITSALSGYTMQSKIPIWLLIAQSGSSQTFVTSSEMLKKGLPATRIISPSFICQTAIPVMKKRTRKRRLKGSRSSWPKASVSAIIMWRVSVIRPAVCAGHWLYRRLSVPGIPLGNPSQQWKEDQVWWTWRVLCSQFPVLNAQPSILEKVGGHWKSVWQSTSGQWRKRIPRMELQEKTLRKKRGSWSLWDPAKRPRVNLKLGAGLILDPSDYLLTCTYIQYYITTTAPAFSSRESSLSSLSTTFFTLCRSTSVIYTRREIGWVSILHTCILVVVPHLRIYLEVPLVYQSTYTGLGI